MEPHTVFVYGTLMPGERNAHVAAQGGVFRAAPATLGGFRLLHLAPEGYPGIVRGRPEDRVRGYALTYEASAWAQARPWLDALEGVDEVPPLYTRERVRLTLGTGAECAAWTYVYARLDRLAGPGVRELPGGDWRAVRGRARRGPDER
ncbi:Uncharacterized conserved protein YtfP, gamma-glutamylcyclotransferase (GGCT)/AIG2-like family [Deinococcus reticulitermitis]|uniref:Putative gamma-glutamylcyclotransferase n=1 Tax=Deinococcus reticulitermitis TaxID=856736 RepID=A0A1H6UN17_9DEIO|nr:gamma-glutamylcyclotransferase family protein [Deinococcus reticulitermitis]SEI89302.1 Uncharacterized conserved protein YtfP, gamma-glutamylcyclotransferase (GGCT)/AIG2-like family [Deinococcus reticulitermitis]